MVFASLMLFEDCQNSDFAFVGASSEGKSAGLNSNMVMIWYSAAVFVIMRERSLKERKR